MRVACNDWDDRTRLRVTHIHGCPGDPWRQHSLKSLITVSIEAKRSQKENEVGSGWVALAMEEDPQGRGKGTTGQSGSRKWRGVGG